MANAPATPPVQTTPAAAPGLKPYQKLNQKTGKVGSIYKYLEGHPRQYRFDAKEGVFNINGTDKIGQTLSFRPIAWRIFTDDILKMGFKQWAELFFVDPSNCVSAILFHGYSVDNILRLIQPLYYDDLSLADVIVTVNLVKKENTKIQPKGVYSIAEFSYKTAPEPVSEAVESFMADTRIYRADTLQETAVFTTAVNYYNPLDAGEEPLTSTGPRQQIAAAVEHHYQADAGENELPY